MRKVWKMVADTQNGEWIMRLAIALGLRRPSERTRRVLALVILCAQHGIDNVRNTSKGDRQAFVASIRKPFKCLADASGAPPVWITVLPSTPADLTTTHPEVYESALNDAGAPPPNPFASTLWEPLLLTTKCRK